MQKEKKEKHFIHKPVYPGGPKAMKKFISQHLQYPEEARKNKIEGTVHLRYTIDYEGNVEEVKVISGLGYGCDEEAIRVVRLLKFEVPKNRGVRAVFHKKVQIHFRKPAKAKAPATTTEYQYHYVDKKEAGKPQEKSGGGDSYSYTINWKKV